MPLEFLEFPLEIRQHIYRYVLQPGDLEWPEVDELRSERHAIKLENQFYMDSPLRPMLASPLLRLNRQIHEEATQLLYSTYVFQFLHGPHALLNEHQPAYVRLPHSAKAKIHNVRLVGDFWHDEDVSSAIARRRVFFDKLRTELVHLRTLEFSAHDYRTKDQVRANDGDPTAVVELLSAFRATEQLVFSKRKDTTQKCVHEICDVLKEKLPNTHISIRYFDRTERSTNFAAMVQWQTIWYNHLHGPIGEHWWQRINISGCSTTEVWIWTGAVLVVLVAAMVWYQWSLGWNI